MLAWNKAAAYASKLSLDQLKAAVSHRDPTTGKRNESKTTLMEKLEQHWQQPIDFEKLTKLGAAAELMLRGKEVPKGPLSKLHAKLREAMQPDAPKEPETDVSMEPVPQQQEHAPIETGAPMEPKEPQQADEELERLRAEVAELRQMKETIERAKAQEQARKEAEEAEEAEKADDDAAAAAAEAASAEEAAAEDAADEAYQLVFEEQLQESRKKKAPKRNRETKFSSPRGRVTKQKEEAHENMQCTLVAARHVTPITKKGFAKKYKPVGKPWKPEAGTNALALPRPDGDLELQLGFVVHGQKTPFYLPVDHVAKESYNMHPGLRDAAQCAGSLSRPLSELREEEAQYEARAMTDWIMRQQSQPVDP